ncbi:unnamed protein product [Lathyrus oleraceus]
MESGGGAKLKSPETQAEEKGNEERNFEKYERIISSSMMRLKQQLHNAEEKNDKYRPKSEPERKRLMSKAIDNILKNMVRLVNVCNVDGFVYGIVPDNGKPISGASENLRYWWKDIVKFDRNGPAAIVKYKQEHVFNVNDAKKYVVEFKEDDYVYLTKLHELQDPTLAIIVSCLMQHGH